MKMKYFIKVKSSFIVGLLVPVRRNVGGKRKRDKQVEQSYYRSNIKGFPFSQKILGGSVTPDRKTTFSYGSRCT